MDETQEVKRGRVIASYNVKITVRADPEADSTRLEDKETPTNEQIEEAVTLGLMRYLPEGATARIESERADR